MPKYGASVLALSDGFLIIGGASSSQTITNDVWRWSGGEEISIKIIHTSYFLDSLSQLDGFSQINFVDMRLWADSSTFHKPIHRLEPGYSKSSPFSFVIFGGEMQYVEDLLLNDLWEFNIGSSLSAFPPDTKTLIPFLFQFLSISNHKSSTLMIMMNQSISKLLP